MKIGLTGKRNGPHPTLDSVGCPGGWNTMARREHSEVAEALLGPPLRENRPRHNPQRSKWGTTSQSRRPGDLPLPSRARQTERFTCARLPLTPVCFLGTFGARGNVPASLLKARGTAGPCSESLPARRISDFSASVRVSAPGIPPRSAADVPMRWHKLSPSPAVICDTALAPTVGVFIESAV